MITIEVKQPLEGPICDFCSDSTVVATHYCDPFAIRFNDDVVEDVDGKWAACAECDLLIRSEKWEALFQRSWKRFREKYGTNDPRLAEEIRAIHNRFISTRKRG